MDIIGWLSAHTELIAIYGIMILFGLFAYAYIIPYFTVRRMRRMLESGEGARMIIQLLQTPITIKDSNGNPHETELANYLVSLVIQNLKMQLNSLKSAMFRGMAGDGGEADGGIGQLLEACPKKWRWAAQLLLPMVAARMQQTNATVSAAQVAAPPVAYKGV